jgi:hypothetical protein
VAGGTDGLGRGVTEAGGRLFGIGETSLDDPGGGERSNGWDDDGGGLEFFGTTAGLGRVAGGLELLLEAFGVGRTATGGVDGEEEPIPATEPLPGRADGGLGRTAGTLLLDIPALGLLLPIVEGG